MKKKAVFGILCVLCAVFLGVTVLRIQFVPLSGGEQVIVCRLPGDNGPGASAGNDLREALMEVYGQPDAPILQASYILEGQAVSVQDATCYVLSYLGRTLDGGRYVSCQAVTTRSVISEENGAVLDEETRTCTYLGYDDSAPNSSVRAAILWETGVETYSDSKEAFDGLLTH